MDVRCRRKAGSPVFGAAARGYSADVLIVHAGNRIDPPERAEPRFPATQIEYVADRVGRVLDALRPAGLVSAPAAGADLIVLDAARRRGIPLHVVLPIEAEAFVGASVADHDAVWLEQFRAVIDHATGDPRSTIWRVGRSGNDDWYHEANDDLLTRAAQIGSEELVVALTIRPPAGEIPHSVTDDFADRAGKAGFIVLSVDPRPSG